MCQNARKMHHSESKKNSGKGTQHPPQTPPHWGGGHPLPKLHPLAPAAPRYSPSALDLPPQTKVLDLPVPKR